METASLTTTTARGGAYVLVRRMSANLLRVGAVAILARKLDAAEFGVVALAQMAVSLLTIFGSGGIITYIVCDRDADWETRVHPAFWLNVVIATASCAIAIAGIPLVLFLYKQPLIAQVLLVILADYFIDQLKMVPEALLQRRLKFRILAARDAGRDFVTSGLAVVMALTGFGVWSLVLPNLAAAPLEVAFTAWAAGYRPIMKLGREHWPRIFRFTRNVMGVQILSFVGNEIDTAVVGKMMGSAALGVYNLAYQLANLIGKNVSAVLAMVSTPALAVAFERKTGIGPPYRKMLRVLSLIGMPLLLGMFVLANELVLLVYGPKWLGAVPLLRIFILFTLVRSVTSPSGTVFNVIGRPDLSMKLSVGFVLVYIPALCWTASRYSIIAVAWCVAIARILIGCISLFTSLQLIDESKRRVTLELAGPFVAGFVMALVTWGLNELLRVSYWPVAARVPVVIVVGAIAYLGLARLLARRAFQEGLALVRGFVRKRGARTA